MFLSQSDAVSVRQEQELRLSNLEDLLGKLTEKSEVCASTFPLREGTCIRLCARIPQCARREFSQCCLRPGSSLYDLQQGCLFHGLQEKGIFSRGPEPLFLLEVTQPPAERLCRARTLDSVNFLLEKLLLSDIGGGLGVAGMFALI